MDTAAIDAAGMKPLAAELAAIDAIKDAKDWTRRSLACTAKTSVWPLSSVLRPTSKTVPTNIAEADQGGLGMPDRDYYTRDDERSKQLRATTSSTSQESLNWPVMLPD